MNDSDSHSIIAGFVQRAEIADQERKYLKAAALLSEALLIEPEHEAGQELLFALARELYFQEEYEQALLIFNLLRQIWSKEGFVNIDYTLYYSGLALMALGEVERGENVLCEAFNMGEDNPEFLRTLGYYLLDTDRYEKGIELLLDAIPIDYEDIDTTLEAITWAYFKNEKPMEALEFLQDIFQDYIYDGSPQVYFRYLNLLDEETIFNALGWLLKKLKSLLDTDLYDEEIIQQILDELNRHQRSLGIKIDLMTENFGTAKDSARMWIEETPNDQNAHVLYTRVLLARKEYEAVIEAANSGLAVILQEPVQERVSERDLSKIPIPDLSEFEPDPIASLLLVKVDALTGLERYQEALETVEQAHKRFPGELIFYRYAASLLLKTDQPKKAWSQIEAARKAKLEFDDPTQSLVTRIKSALTKS